MTGRMLQALLLAGAQAGLAAPSPSPAEILAAADAVRNPAGSFQVDLAMVDYRDQKEQERTQLRVYARLDPGNGQYDNLVRYLEPARERHKLILKNGPEIWFYDRSSNAGVRLSAQQRLLGQAANGDVVTVNLARDYRALLDGEEKLLDGDRKERACLRLKLTAASPEAAYREITYWVEKGSHHPIKGMFYADSGRLLKTAFYRRYEQHLGRLRPTETVLLDGVDPRWVTLMRCTGFRSRAIPDAWLRRDGLATFHD